MAAKTEKGKKAANVEKAEETKTVKRTVKKIEKAEAAEKTEKPARTKKAEQVEGNERDLTRDDIIGRYLEIYRRCMTEDPKSFDARGAAHALEQISKLLGLTVSAKDTDGNEIVLTLSEEADAFGQ